MKDFDNHIMTMESASYLFLLLFVSMQSPHPAEGGTTITRGISQEYGFMETARFEDCGVGGLGAFLNTSAYNRAECGIRCLMEDDCLSFEYDMENKTCSFFDYGALPFLRPKFGFVFADSVDPKVVSRPYFFLNLSKVYNTFFQSTDESVLKNLPIAVRRTILFMFLFYD